MLPKRRGPTTAARGSATAERGHTTAGYFPIVNANPYIKLFEKRMMRPYHIIN